MSKISQYLNEHLLGEVTTNAGIRRELSHDASVLSMTPEIVVYPRITNDVRKVLRFTYQLAEKGHAMNVTARGSGSDQTGAALSNGILVNLNAHMNRVFEFDSRQRLLRVQPGAQYAAVQDALGLQGCALPVTPDSAAYSTIGGAVANNASGRTSGKSGAIDESVVELEVVLANGDVLQTKRLSKKDLNRKKGLQTLEGEIYRSVDNLIEDNKALIKSKLDTETIDNSGYPGLAKVKHKNGSFDLTPLFVGSQGTLGIISEMILKAELREADPSLAVVAVPDREALIDCIDEIRACEVDSIELYDGRLVARAEGYGKRYAALKFEDDKDSSPVAGVLLVAVADASDSKRKRKFKKIQKLAEKHGAIFETATDDVKTQEFAALRGLAAMPTSAEQKTNVASALFRGIYVPHNRLTEFTKQYHALEKSSGVDMPIAGVASDGVYSFLPQVSLRVAADKQRVIKLFDAFTKIVYSCGGSVVGESGEGRFKTVFTRAQLDKDVRKLYDDVRAIFDAQGTLNHGVKQEGDVRGIVSHLRTGYDGSDFAEYASPN